MDHSAMTPAGFVEQVRRMQSSGSSAAQRDAVEEIQIEFVDAVEGSEFTTPVNPRSFGPSS